MKNFLICLLCLLSFNSFSQKPDAAKYVWLNDCEKYDNYGGRHQMVVFRYDVQLDEIPDMAELNVYASSRYLLKVNGVNINWGPARNYPEAPEYDTHDLLPFLKKGKNAMAVRVMSNGMNTFQLVKHIGGFIAWGEIKTSRKSYNLVTPGEWNCKQDMGYDQKTPKMTFAQGTMDIYDARKGLTEWDLPITNTENWNNPFIIKNQNAWGELVPRSIPFLTQNEIIPRNNLAQYTLKDEEDIYSFRNVIPDPEAKLYKRNPWVLAYTYIYSPYDQEIPIGMWWGEHYLNGELLNSTRQEEGMYRRLNYHVKLKKGWNYFFVKYNIGWVYWDFYMYLPIDKGLVLSPNKKMNDDIFVMSTGPYNEEEDRIIKALTLPIDPDQLPGLFASWVGHKKGNHANNPAVDIANSVFDKKINIHSSKVGDIKFSDKNNAIVFDMGQNTYGRIFVEYTAPEGTIVDVAWAEEEENDRIFLLKQVGLYMAFRHIAKEGINYFEMSRPNGHRLIHLNVTNNNGTTTIHKIGTIKQNYPMEEIGAFECSDRMLNSVWQLGKRTIMLCADDVYTDPFRERGLYAGDLLPETTLGYVVSGETQLTRKSMQQIQGLYAKQMLPNPDSISIQDRHNLNVLADYPFITLLNLWWYIQITKDIDFLKSSYPKYKYLMENTMQQRDEKGIFTERHSFIEWIQIARPAQLASMQALIAQSFETIALMAAEVGENDDVEKFIQVAKEAKEALHKYFWDEKQGAYFDGYKNSERIDHYFPISSAWPVLFDKSTNEQNIKINAFLTEELDSIGNVSRQNKSTPYGGFYVLGALYRLQNAETAEMYMRKYWSNMILDGDDTAWENFGKDGGQGSLSHGWSGGPTWYMSTYTLGVQLGFPEPTDLTKVTIAPQAQTIEWAKGVVPHPTGAVTVDWKVQGNNLFINYEVAKGVTVIVQPKGRLAAKVIWVNGVKR